MNKKQEQKASFRKALLASECPLMFYPDAENRNIHASGSYIDYIRWMKKLSLNDALRDSLLIYDNFDSDSKKTFRDVFLDDFERVDFCGGKFSDLFLPKKDLSAYHKAYNDFKKSKFLEQLKLNFSFKNRPKRIMSEHEGDWDYDRRFDILSFNHKKLGLMRHKKIDIDMKISFNCGFGAESINAYGAYGAVLVKLLEDCGLLVRLTVSTSSQNSYKNGLGDTSCFLVKNYNEYMSPQYLLRACSANFFRRACFLKKVLGAVHEGTNVDSGLGQSRTFNNFFRFNDGQIYIQNMVDSSNSHELARKIALELESHFSAQELAS